jgi:hypothetical protein
MTRDLKNECETVLEKVLGPIIEKPPTVKKIESEVLVRR